MIDEAFNSHSNLAAPVPARDEYRQIVIDALKLTDVDFKFDFVIVGAGSAGCVLANRLVKIPHTEC